MYIRNPEGFATSFWDWTILDGCFGDTKIRPMDCEGIVERNGLFLYLETKQPDEKMGRGQRITLEALARTGLFTVMIIWGKRNEPERIEILTQSKRLKPKPCNLDGFRDYVSRWFKWANGGSING